MLKNLANNTSTNIFETFVGALNIAPTKISGKYKIVVALDGNLYLNDYNDRQVLIDKSKPFLPQVSNFLKVNTTINNTASLRYGGFQKSTKKYFHIPLYLGTSDLPTYYVLSRVVNETIESEEVLYKYGQIQQVVDLEKIGLKAIFDEILFEDYFNFPVYFNWENNNIKLYGYSIEKDTPSVFTFDILDSQSNQPYFEQFNNKILNKFDEQKLFFPRFLNIEFEFSYSNEYIPFNNFYGFLSTSEEVSVITKDDSFHVKLQDYSNKTIVWEQQTLNSQTVLNHYIDIVGSGSVKEIGLQLPQLKFQTTRLSINDKITIKHPNGDVEFEYVVTEQDIDASSLLVSLSNVCYKATNKSLHNFLFTVKKIYNVYQITIVSNIVDILFEEYEITLPNYFKIVDRFEGDSNYFQFREINVNDIWLSGKPNLLNNIQTIMIDDVYYQIMEKFKFDDKTIIRLDKPAQIVRIAECKIYQIEQEKLIKFIPIPFLVYYSNLKSYLPYEQNLYVRELIDNFGDNTAIQLFNDSSNVTESLYQYIKENTTTQELDDVDVIDLIDHNTDICLNMIFNTMGQTSYITPDVLNIDKQFYLQNGNLDIDLLDTDKLRYNWFLIKGKCPEYLKNDVRQLRYFTDLPKVTSRLLKIVPGYCETIFLGVKYQLPGKYEDYQFAVYLDFNNKVDGELSYKYIVNNEAKTIYLTINKYLDFVDLLRGGVDTNEALLDLSFFYSVNNSFNNSSEYLGDFKSSVIKLCDEFKELDESIYFDTVEVRDWKYQNPVDGKWYIALRQELSSNELKINDLRMLFNVENPNSTFHVYSTVTTNDGVEHTYTSMTVTVKGIIYVTEKYLWCEDVSIKFFDTQEIFLKLYNDTTKIEDIFLVDKILILNSTNASGDVFPDYIKIGTVVIDATNKQFELIVPDKEISIKEYYFEINQSIIEDSDGSKIALRNVFTFPECLLGLTDNEIITNFGSTVVDQTVYFFKINLFSRNQIWRVIQDLFKVDLKFKFLSKDMVRKLINKFMITNLIDYIAVNSLPIENGTTPTEFIKFQVIEIDKNIAIWNILNEKKLIMFNRFRSAYLPFMSLSESVKEFQLERFKKTSTFFNIYDKDFGGTSISATGLWEEVIGNVISSLYCKENDIEITIPFSLDVNYKNLFIDSLDLNKIIINNFNESYIAKFNQNVNEYILETYTEYLLKTFFNFDSVVNEYNQRLDFVTDKQNPNLIHFKQQIDYNSLTFIFKRK